MSNPFDSIESSYEYVCLLREVLEEARQTVENEVACATAAPRRLQAMQLILYKLNQLDEHPSACRRALNDLRTLRRLILGERESAGRPIGTDACERRGDRLWRCGSVTSTAC